MTRFKDKVAIVTGGAGGIGRAICQRLHDEGARVLMVDIAPEESEQVARQIMAGGGPEVIAFRCDVSKEAEVQAACEEAIKRWERLDVAVNNAGLMTFKPIVDLDEEDWLTVLKVNLIGSAHLIKHGFRWMKPGSAIVNVSSIHALQTSPDAAPYAAAKAAMVSLTRTASIEGKPLGIRVNALLPGAISTPMLWDNPNVQSGVETIHPSDVGKPEDMAAAVAFLASDDAAFVTGTALIADGGRLAKL